MKFKCKQPCNNCPYRKDAPLKLWSPDEFAQLLENDAAIFGNVYGCHKNNGSICVGYLIDQDRRRFPNINLRMMLSRLQIDRKYLDQLKSPAPMYSSIKEMISANFKHLIKK